MVSQILRKGQGGNGGIVMVINLSRDASQRHTEGTHKNNDVKWAETAGRTEIMYYIKQD
jgi:hypothetical protein